MDNYDLVIAKNLEKLARFNFAIIENRTGARFDVDTESLSVPFFGEDFIVTKNSCSYKNGSSSSNKDKILIIDYLLSFGSQEIGDDWIDFREIPQSMPYDAAFRTNVESVLEKNFDAILTRQELLLKKFNGYYIQSFEHCAFAAAFQVFPRLECLVLLTRGDDEIGPGAKILFSSNAHSFMTTESLAAIAETLTNRLIGS